mmetsp:Transcript_138402/g.442281  ORF Transcript_138402/g.442281 Transcript_138402/m.442281 type:complete len:207 (-) Transcript_138402:1006-1626(-)
MLVDVLAIGLAHDAGGELIGAGLGGRLGGADAAAGGRGFGGFARPFGRHRRPRGGARIAGRCAGVDRAGSCYATRPVPDVGRVAIGALLWPHERQLRCGRRCCAGSVAGRILWRGRSSARRPRLARARGGRARAHGGVGSSCCRSVVAAGAASRACSTTSAGPAGSAARLARARASRRGGGAVAAAGAEPVAHEGALVARVLGRGG